MTEGRDPCDRGLIMPCLRSALFDHQALDGAAEIAAIVGEPRHREARTVGTDPGFRIEQDPVAGRLARNSR